MGNRTFALAKRHKKWQKREKEGENEWLVHIKRRRRRASSINSYFRERCATVGKVFAAGMLVMGQLHAKGKQRERDVAKETPRKAKLYLIFTFVYDLMRGG